MDARQRLAKLLHDQPIGRPAAYSPPSILAPAAAGTPPPATTPAARTSAVIPYTIPDAGRDLKLDPAIIEAFAAVESVQGAFDSTGRPVILFERHIFDQKTNGAYRAEAPDLSNPNRGGYGKYAAQHDRLARARALGRGAADAAAVMATSWGRWQIMGFNHLPAGFMTLRDFETAMRRSEADQLRAFVAFMRHEGIDGLLRAGDFEGAVRKYNGTGQALYYLGKFNDALKRAREKKRKK
jgi:hypothetical protein